MPERTSVPRVCSTALPPLQFCPLFREAKHDRGSRSTFYSSAPSSEKQDRTAVPGARSTVLHSLQRSKQTVAPSSNAARTAVAGQHQWRTFCRKTTTFIQTIGLTTQLRKLHARTQKKKGGLELSVQTGMLPMDVSLSVLLEVKSCTRKISSILLANRRGSSIKETGHASRRWNRH